jgi:biopolymer transport protein ExbB
MRRISSLLPTAFLRTTGLLRTAGLLRNTVAFTVTLALVIGTLSTQVEAQTLEQAYKREFAFLAAEKNALQARVNEMEASGRDRIAAAQAEIDQLQGQVLAASMQAERLSESLLDAERDAEVAAEHSDVIGSMLTQAAATLEKGGIQLPTVKGDDRAGQVKQLRFAFEKALPLLSEFSSVRKTPGTFFDERGKRIEGTILQLGQVAAYGVHDQASGVLAPAGGDRLKVWPEAKTGNLAKSILEGNAPSVISLFLFESLDKGVEEKQEKTALMVVQSGGVIGWVIVSMGLIALLMIIVRAFLLFRSSARTDELVDDLTPLLQKGRIDEARALCKSAKTSAGRVLKTTLEYLHKDRDTLQDAISEAILRETPKIDRFGQAIVVVAAVAPLLGLLGTVTGMIATFDIITEFGTGNPKLLSGGISVALVTTELGLIVAIPTLMLGNLLNGWGSRIKEDLDKSALRISNVASGVQLSWRPPLVEEPTVPGGALQTP